MTPSTEIGLEALPEFVPERRFGISGLMSLIGSLLILGAFFLPLVNTGSIFNDILPEELAFIDTAVNMDEQSIAEGKRKQFAAGRKVLSTTGVDLYLEDLANAETNEQIEEVIQSHSISTLDLARGIWVINTNTDALMLAQQEKAVFLWILVSIGWIVAMSGIAGLLPLLRRIQPLNAFQLSWNGTFGLILFVGSLLLLMMSNRFEYESNIRIDYVQAPTSLVFIGGSALIWISAFAGLNRTNWWKGPVIGVFLLAFAAVTFVASGSLFLG